MAKAPVLGGGGSVGIALWPEVDRVALCIHRPTSRDPRFRELVERLGIGAGSIVVSAARYVAAGRVTLEDLELMSRYESRSLIAANADYHVEAGFLQRGDDDGVFVPVPSFRDAATATLALQVESADELWRTRASEVEELADLVSRIVAVVVRPVATPAFDGQVASHHVLPATPTSTVLGRVTELRYLRSDLHAHALSEVGVAGPRARALDRLWKGHPIDDDEGERLRTRELARKVDGRWQLTTAARDARADAEARTDELSEGAFATVADTDVTRLLDLLRSLPGEDPRPPDAR